MFLKNFKNSHENTYVGIFFLMKFRVFLKTVFHNPWAQVLNWTYIRHLEDVQDVFWTSYKRSICVLCLGDRACVMATSKMRVTWLNQKISNLPLGNASSCLHLSRQQIPLDTQHLIDIKADCSKLYYRSKTCKHCHQFLRQPTLRNTKQRTNKSSKKGKMWQLY